MPYSDNNARSPDNANSLVQGIEGVERLEKLSRFLAVIKEDFRAGKLTEEDLLPLFDALARKTIALREDSSEKMVNIIYGRLNGDSFNALSQKFYHDIKSVLRFLGKNRQDIIPIEREGRDKQLSDSNSDGEERFPHTVQYLGHLVALDRIPVSSFFKAMKLFRVLGAGREARLVMLESSLALHSRKPEEFKGPETNPHCEELCQVIVAYLRDPVGARLPKITRDIQFIGDAGYLSDEHKAKIQQAHVNAKELQAFSKRWDNNTWVGNTLPSLKP